MNFGTHKKSTISTEHPKRVKKSIRWVSHNVLRDYFDEGLITESEYYRLCQEKNKLDKELLRKLATQ